MGITEPVRQRALLLHYAGSEVNDIFDTLPDTGNVDDYTVAKQKLKGYFSPQTNKIFNVYQFRQAKQEQGEPLDNFQTRLRKLSSNCEFANTDEEIRNQIVFGCSSQKLRRHALAKTMNLADLLAAGRALELSERNAQDVEGTSAGACANVNSVSKSQSRSRPRYPSKPSQPRARSASAHSRTGRPVHHSRPRKRKCYFCGYDYPHRGRCPATDEECRACHKIGHFAGVCRSTGRGRTPSRTPGPHHSGKNTTHQDRSQLSSVQDSRVTQDTTEEEYIFTAYSTHPRLPSCKVKIENTEVTVLVDSGAAVDIIDENTFHMVKANNSDLPLYKTTKNIYPYGASTPLPVLGCFNAQVQTQSQRTQACCYVVQGSSGNLLSCKTLRQLGLVKFSSEVNVAQANLSSTVDGYEKKFPGLFTGVGRVKNKQVHLHIDPTVAPKQQKHRRIPFHVRQDVEKELKRLEEADIIEKVEGPTPWINPIVVVPKKSGEVRLCIDMREANQAIQREKHIMPTIDDLRNDLNGATVFSVLDLRSGYHQLELDAESRPITTFTTHVGLRRYKRLLFGINAASEIFQETIAEMIADLPGCRNISDDVIVWGQDDKSHDDNLLAVLKRLHEQGVTLNPEKCRFRQRSVSFYGHVFGEGGISVDEKKVDAINKTPSPQNVGQLRSFLGMTQYVAAFIQNYAALSAPLRNLTRQDVTWEWTTEHEQAFNDLKAALCGCEVMDYFDPEKETTLIVDGSPIGLGAILMQDKVVAYGSRALTETETRYSQTERELLAITWAVEHFHLYLYGAKFRVITDHKPLLGIVKSKKMASPRLERLKLRLAPYDFELTYKAGKNPENPADFMSRHPNIDTPIPEDITPTELYVNYVCDNAVPKAMTLVEVRNETKMDPELQQLITAIQTDIWPDELKPYAKMKHEFAVCSGIILRGNRIVMPTSLQQKAVDLAHIGHQGVVKTKSLLREKVWFRGIDKLVEDKVHGCLPCQAATPANPKPAEPLKMTELPKGPWQEVNVDFVGPFPSGEYVLVVIDSYSKFPETEIVYSTSANATIPKLDAIFARQGIPVTVTTDNGPPFSGHEFSKFAQQLGFKHRKITPLWPQANSEAERFMQPLQKAIRAAHMRKLNWKQEMQKFLRHYRATPHSVLRISPFEALTSRKMRTVLPDIPPTSETDKHIRDRDRMMKAKMKAYADEQSHAKPSDLAPGDTVLLKQPKQNKLSTPFDPRPYQVETTKGSMITARGGSHNGTVTRNSSFFKKVSIPYVPHSKDEEEEPPVYTDTRQIIPVNSEPDNERVGISEPEPLQEVPMQLQSPRSILKSPPVLRRSSREVKRPVRFEDYVKCVVY